MHNGNESITACNARLHIPGQDVSYCISYEMILSFIVFEKVNFLPQQRTQDRQVAKRLL